LRQMNGLMATGCAFPRPDGSAEPAATGTDDRQPGLPPDGTAETLCQRGEVLRAAPATRPPVPGYEILGELGRGSMGVVYKARCVALNRLVALKMILVGGHSGTEERSRFRTEGEAIARLQHPNIVQIHEVGEA